MTSRERTKADAETPPSKATVSHPLRIQDVPIDEHCTGDRWSAQDEAQLARLIAIIAMGQAAYAAYILKQLLPASPPFNHDDLRSEARLKLMVQEDGKKPRTGYPRWQRDGFVFEAISWIAARQAHGERAFLRDPHISATSQGLDGLMIELADDKSKVGSIDLLLRLKKRVADEVGSLPVNVEGWLIWTVTWLAEDEDARESLLYDVKKSILGACGAKKDGEITAEELTLILPGLLAWISGSPLVVVEKELGGDPDAGSLVKQVCPRARELVGSVIPRGFSFIMGLVSHVVEEVNPFDTQDTLSRHLVECLGIAVRKGYDMPEKVFFAGDHPSVLSRVQMHQLWIEQNASS